VAERFELRVAGHRLEACRWGLPQTDALTLVLLHEGLGCVDLWRDWPEQLAAATGHTVLAYSRTGYGRSEPVTLPRPLRYMHDEAELLPAVLEAAGVRACVLVGHSDGASIALIHAGSPNRSKSIRALALLAPHVFCEELSVRSIAAAKEAYSTGELREKLRRYHGDNVDGAFWGWNRAWLDPDFKRWNLEEYLGGIDLPVLVVQGTDDAYGTLAQVEAIHRGVKGRFSRRVLEACGHSPQRDQPAQTTAAVVELVRSL
jgi:pimeloyl-ACP methyl ester carboxylesterase